MQVAAPAEFAQRSVLALMAIVLGGVCALLFVRVRSRRPKITFDGLPPAFKLSLNSSADAPDEHTTSVLSRRQRLQVHAPAPENGADHLQRALVSCLRSVTACSCFKADLPMAPKPFAVLQPAPAALAPPLAPTAPPPTPARATAEAVAAGAAASGWRAARHCTNRIDASAKMSPAAAARLASNFELVELRVAQPGLAHEIDLILHDVEWQHCFWAASDHDVEAATRLIRSFASFRADFKLEEAQVAEILDAGLIDILAGGGDDCAVVAVVRDIRVLDNLLQAHSFKDVVAAHLVQLERLLRTSKRARRYGVSMVHDLSQLSLSLIGRMMDPRNLPAQLHGSRFLFTAFPVRFQTIVVVDAPPAFGMLLNAVQAVAPGAIPKPLQFVSRPEAASYCEHVFRQPVLQPE